MPFYTQGIAEITVVSTDVLKEMHVITFTRTYKNSSTQHGILIFLKKFPHFVHYGFGRD